MNTRNAPMGKHNLHAQVSFDRCDAMICFHVQGDNMSDLTGQLRRVESAHGEDSSGNRVGIPLWQISAAGHDIGQEQAWIGTVLTSMGQFILCQRVLDPNRFDDGDESITSGVIIWEIGGGRDDMCDAFEGRTVLIVVIDHHFAFVKS